ncbi:gamma-tubulin complex component 6-like [Ylistrum balloti]|uniref:gamma-tubulin complex component 6-like n=1 Tax=Ylistrum balloti TaxID=509963 RepID=UPI00290594C7|nr:gamma-tubulin complex component 6-like [Ylistrum balloti]
MSTLEDSVTALIKQLCVLHTNGPRRAFLKQPTLSKSEIQKRLKKKAYETIFAYLVGPIRWQRQISVQNTHLEDERVHILSYAFDLRCRRHYDDANRLEELLENLVDISNVNVDEHIKENESDMRSILKFLVLLADTGQQESRAVMGYETQHLPKSIDKEEVGVLPSGPMLYGDTCVYRPDHKFYTHFPSVLFEAEPLQFQEDKSLEIFRLAPGESLSGQGLFNIKGYLGDSYERQCSGTLFGGLVQSQVVSLQDRLQLPNLADSEDSGLFDVRIPKVQYSNRSQTSAEDDSAVHSLDMTGSTQLQQLEGSKSLSYISDSDSAVGCSIWEEALEFTPSKHFKWETRGCEPGTRPDRPYLSEAGPTGLDMWYSMKLKELSILCPSVSPPTLRLMNQRDVVRDIINMMIGVPSATYQLIPETQSFEMAEGIYLSGMTPECLHRVSHDFLLCGTYYNLLVQFSLPPFIDSFYSKGLVYQAFCGAIRKYLQHYRGVILSIPPNISLLRLKFICQKIFKQISFLADLCKCTTMEDLQDEESFPTGVHLLSYVYRKCLECTCTDNYPMMMSILQSSCGPYTVFVQDWVFHGICQDIYGEFMIETHADYLQFRDKNYWNSGYKLMTNEAADSVPLFLADLASDIFICGKSINLLKACCPQNFLCNIADIDIPRISVTFSEEELGGLDGQCQFYVNKMKQIARQMTISRQEKLEIEEAAKKDLLQKAKEVATQEIQKLQARMQENKVIQDTKKRKEFQFLKDQMEADLQRRADKKEQIKQEDKMMIARVTKQEEAMSIQELELERKAREELIEYYSKLSEEATLREQRALWHVKRAQLAETRRDFLQQDDVRWQAELDKSSIVTEPVTAQKPDNMLADTANLPSWAVEKGRDGPVIVTGEEDTPLPGWAQRGLTRTTTLTVDSSMPAWAQQELPQSETGEDLSPEKTKTPRSLPTPPSRPAGRPSTPTLQRPPTPTLKTGKRLSDTFYATAQTEESPTKSSIYVFPDKHATSETDPDDGHKLQIKLVQNVNVNKESVENPECLHIKLAEGMHVSKETESQEGVVPHRRTATGMSANKQSTEERALPRMKKSEEMHGTKETESTEWLIKKSSTFGHVSKMSTSGDEFVIQAPRLKKSEQFHSSIESKFSKDFGIKPRIRMSKTMSSTTESKPIEYSRPGIKIGQMSASVESEMVDQDENRLQKFKSFNIHGHSSDSTVQKLLYGEKKAKHEVKEQEVDDIRKEPVWLDSPATQMFTYEDNFEFLTNTPVVDLLSSKELSAYGRFGDYGISQTDDVDLYRYMPLPQLLERSVTGPLLAQISLVNDNVINYFTVDLEIKNHFEALRCYLFMGDGDFAQILSDILLEKLANSPKAQEMLNPVFLTNALNKALKSSMHADDPFADNLSFALRYVPKVLMQNAHDTLDCLELRYKVTWPLNIVITDSLISKYSKVFSFMLQLKRTVWVLKDVWYRLKRDALVHKAGGSSQFRQLQLYRQEMQHFVKVMQGYIANQVIHVTWCEFTEALSNDVHNLDDLHKVHSNYLDKAIFRCLLNKKAGAVMKIIQDIFSLILKFRLQLVNAEWRYDVDTGHPAHSNFQNMVASYKAFREYSVFLFKIVNKLAIRGYQPHLQELLLRLNFNDYYKAR